MAAVAEIWLQAVADDRKAQIRDPASRWREVALREEWSVEEARALVGGLLDLSDAYTQ